MKKIFIILLLAFTMFTFACDNNDMMTYEEEYEQAVKANEKAYKHYEKNKNKYYKGGVGLEIDIYYGKYGKTYIVDTNHNGSHFTEVNIKLGKYTFVFWQESLVPLAIYNKRYYDLEEAYEKGYLSDEDVKAFYDVYLVQEKLFYNTNACFLDVRNAFFNKVLKNVEEASYKSVEIFDALDTKHLNDSLNIQVIARFNSPYLENKKIDKEVKVGSFKFEYEYTNDIIYVMHNNVLYTLEEAYNEINKFSELLPAIYGYYLNGDINKIDLDSIKEYFYEYYKEYGVTLEDVEITNVIGLYKSDYGAVIVAQIQPGIGYNLHTERVYEKYIYKFVFENDYNDLDIIDLYNNEIVKLDKAMLTILKQDALEDIKDQLDIE